MRGRGESKAVRTFPAAQDVLGTASVVGAGNKQNK